MSKVTKIEIAVCDGNGNIVSKQRHQLSVEAEAYVSYLTEIDVIPDQNCYEYEDSYEWEGGESVIIYTYDGTGLDRFLSGFGKKGA